MTGNRHPVPLMWPHLPLTSEGAGGGEWRVMGFLRTQGREMLGHREGQKSGLPLSRFFRVQTQPCF